MTPRTKGSVMHGHSPPSGSQIPYGKSSRKRRWNMKRTITLQALYNILFTVLYIGTIKVASAFTFVRRRSDFPLFSDSSFHFVTSSGLAASLQENDPTTRRITTLDSIERIWCLSDIHADHSENMKWLKKHAATLDPTKDLLICAGDISHEMETLQSALQVFNCPVVFCVGNHEAWIANRESFQTSFEKIDAIYNWCSSAGIHVLDPLYIPGPHPVYILPLDSWYDGSLSFSEELCHDFNKWPWVDFARCKWPGYMVPHDRIPHGLVERFLESNTDKIDIVNSSLEQQPDASLISFSHFLPNFQCLPDWKDLNAETFNTEDWLDHGGGGMSAKFAKVAGSVLLDHQIRSIHVSSNKHLHVFGHSHRPKDFTYKGIRYIHNPLGKPRERSMYMVSPTVTFQQIWDRRTGEVQGETILRFWEEKGGGREALWERLERIKPGRYGRKGAL